jgi:hypothetical protein
MLIITKEDSYRAGALVRVLRETEARYYVEPVRNAAGRRTPGGGLFTVRRLAAGFTSLKTVYCCLTQQKPTTKNTTRCTNTKNCS